MKALKTFYATQGRLPLSGVVPDMVSTTELFLELQRVYVAKANADRESMAELVKSVCGDRNLSQDTVTADELNLFCKNSAQIRVIKMRSIEEELQTPDWEDVQDEWADPSNTSVRFLLAMKAFEAATEAGNPQLGEVEANLDADLEILKAQAKKLTDNAGVGELEVKYLQEMLRFGKSKLHNVSAFLGGVAAQEACKLLMSQYIPMNHTFVYDAMHARGAVFKV